MRIYFLIYILRFANKTINFVYNKERLMPLSIVCALFIFENQASTVMIADVFATI